MRESIAESAKPLIVVAGATSKQGRSVVTSLLGSGGFRVRALTRDADSAQAQNLARQGAEIAEVPLTLGHDRELVEAFASADGAFLMTPPIAPPSEEYSLGCQFADAAVEAGVSHIVFSALENVQERTSGTEWAPHFTDKARIAEHIQALPITSTFVMLSFFYTNALEYYTPRIEGDTVLMPFYLPEDCRAPFVDPLTATGPAVLEVFSHPDTYRGAYLPVVGDVISPAEMVETFSRVTGLKAEYRDAYSRDGLLTYFPALGDNPLLVDETLGMVHYAAEFGYFRDDRDTAWSRKVDPTTLNWEQFLRKTEWRGQPVSFNH